MDNANFKALVERLDSPEPNVHAVTISDEEMTSLTPEQVEEIVVRFGSNTLITLPTREQEFFAWLKANDPAVWEDLWGDVENPYVVSIGFLMDLMPKRRGFAICDLVNSPNYFFSADNITSDEGKVLLDAGLDIVAGNGQLTLEQAFIIEVWRAPIDQWRFAYMYNVPLEDVKALVQSMLADHLLIQLPTEEELAALESQEDSDDSGQSMEEYVKGDDDE